MKKNFLLITGGTGGHVIPAKNFANYLFIKNTKCTIITDKRGQKYFNNFNGKIYVISSSNLNGNLIFKIFGIFQILFGIIKVAQYVKYISYPVLSGFMGGIGIIIILFQWNSFFGDPPRKEIFDILGHLPDPIIHHHWSAMILGLST